MRGGGSANRSCSASFASAKSITAVGLVRILAANRSSQSFHSADPRMVIAFGCDGLMAGLAVALVAGLAVGFLLTVAPSVAGPSYGPSIDGACATGKLGMGNGAVVFMTPVYARLNLRSSSAYAAQY